MRDSESSFSDPSAYILVAAGTHDESAIALVRALREAGLRVTFAETANIAARASEAVACVVILTPDTWKAQTIATVMRAKPACLIPVLAEPMELPRGPWTHEAIHADDISLAEQELLQALQSYLARLPHTSTVTHAKSGELSFPPLVARSKSQRARNTGVILTFLLLLLIVGLGGLSVYHYYTTQLRSAGPTISGSGFLNATSPTQSINNTYVAKVPGAPCDAEGGQWDIGSRYKKDKNTEVLDKYTNLQCQADGALLTRSGDYTTYSEIFFDGTSSYSPLAQHFLVQFDATVVAGDAHASIVIDTHIDNNSYARYSFSINTLGHWEAHTNDPNGVDYLNRLAIGFLPKGARTYTLALETNGAVMTFFINNRKIATVIDATYNVNDSIAFGISDPTAKTPISARFSHFSYEAMPTNSLTLPQVLATATSQTRDTQKSVYSAHVPGYGCDHGTGQWQSLTDIQARGSLHCTANGLQITAPGKTPYITEENFYWLNGSFPTNYKISVHITMTDATPACAGISTRNGEQDSFYAFSICPDGYWEIAFLSDKFHTLAQGMTNVQTTYEITAVAKGSSQSLFINGVLIKTVKDSHLTSTDHISLLSGTHMSDISSTATFSDFVFTPLA
ncbi:MAG TPA: hypothetical protein VFN35_02410 [Ktedonobacteraceae bacterium]|nr:hypothetical protein [Ktedonobacteraceae bacterium]